MHQDPGERSSDPVSDWPRLTSESPGVFSEVMGQQWPAMGWGHCSAQQCLHGTFWGGHHYLYYLHNNLDSDQTTGREHSPAHQQKIGLNIDWAQPRPSEQDPVFPSASLSHQEASKSLVSFPIFMKRPLECLALSNAPQLLFVFKFLWSWFLSVVVGVSANIFCNSCSFLITCWEYGTQEYLVLRNIFVINNYPDTYTCLCTYLEETI